MTGAAVEPHTLLVANHISWLDIFVLAKATGCAFVSKDSLGHPLVHWLADQNDTLYVRREHRRGAADQAQAIASRLQEPKPLALFPEGTTGPGDRLLPFRPTLLVGVAPQPPGVKVRPVAIDYGESAQELGWHEESAKENVLKVLGRRNRIAVTIRLLHPLAPTGDRKVLAQAARTAIEQALTSSRPSATL